MDRYTDLKSGVHDLNLDRLLDALYIFLGHRYYGGGIVLAGSIYVAIRHVLVGRDSRICGGQSTWHYSGYLIAEFQCTRFHKPLL